MKNDNKNYILMHKDTKVLWFSLNGKIKVLNEKFLPYGLYVEEKNDADACVNNILNIFNFLARRVISIDRKYSKIIYNFINLPQNNDDKTKAMFAISYHALNLTDCYFVKEENEDICFKDINLYDNSLSNAFVDIFLKGKMITINKDSLDSRDIGTSGYCPKSWVRDKNGIFYLYKDGNVKEVNNEVLASKIASCFMINAVKYELKKYKGDIVSRCKIITDKNHSLLNKMDLEIYCQNNDIDFYEYILKLDKYNYYMMNIIDYLIGNSDRHVNNWGVLIDNKSNKIIRLYDLMDFNKAFTDYKNLDGMNSQTTKEKMTMKEAAVIAVKNIGLNQIKTVNKSCFDTKMKWEMFNRRLHLLKQAI